MIWPVCARCSSEIASIVSDAGSSRSSERERVAELLFLRGGVADLLVEAREIAHAERGHQPVAFLHLAD
ncbi:hypothetical protein ACEPUR_21515, partial [Burkholderia pseudomallei]|uniref:hypothetical protein n=1 Tax=Burkholderia pseudomallei TaxID=28450 RepID=UPI0035901778